MRSHDHQLPYAEVTEPEFGDAVAKTFRLVHVATGTAILRGHCPRCHALIDIPIVDELYRLTGGGAAADYEAMICLCAGEHPGRPEGFDGCGAYWTVRVQAGSR